MGAAGRALVGDVGAGGLATQSEHRSMAFSPSSSPPSSLSPPSSPSLLAPLLAPLAPLPPTMAGWWPPQCPTHLFQWGATFRARASEGAAGAVGFGKLREDR